VAHVLHDDIPLVVTLYDLIPLLEPERYAGDPERLRRYHIRARFPAQADLVLVISEHTATQAVEHLGVDPDRVVTVGAGVSPFFHPATAAEASGVLVARDLPAITRPFVLAVVGGEPRKNTQRLLDAWAPLGPRLRTDHQLV
jgi:glycosyltransferase involved in cell wall biosynthesis